LNGVIQVNDTTVKMKIKVNYEPQDLSLTR